MAKPQLDDRDVEAVVAVLRSGHIASGPKVKEFEEQFARWLGAKHAIAVANGTVALHSMMLAAGVNPGDKVLTTPFTFIASASSIVHAGAVPMFADVDDATYGLDVASVRRALVAGKGSIRAVLVVHLYGLPADVKGLQKACDEHGALLLEDCAQAHGATVDGKKVGTFGKASAFSFYATKNLTTGEGGMIVTDDDDVAARARKLINHGRAAQYAHDLIGFNHRLTDLQAAVGLAQLPRLDEGNTARRRIAARYGEAFASLARAGKLALPVEPAGTTHVYHQYVVRTSQRDALKAHLAQAQIDSAVVYPTPVCQQPCFAGACGCAKPGDQCPTSTRLAHDVLALPVHPGLSDDDVARVIAAVRAFFAEAA